MRDVAALAGVSLKTVSRVVNDEPSVSSAVAARVPAPAHASPHSGSGTEPDGGTEIT